MRGRDFEPSLAMATSNWRMQAETDSRQPYTESKERLAWTAAVHGQNCDYP